MIGRRPSIVSALEALKPKSEWTLRGETYADLEWLDKNQTKPTEEEVNAKISELEKGEPMRLLRQERNKLIAETDWMTIKYLESGIAMSASWKDYRQKLRDLPASSNPKLNSDGLLDMTSVTWPTPPSSPPASPPSSPPASPPSSPSSSGYGY